MDKEENQYSDDPNVKTLSRSDIAEMTRAIENDWVTNSEFLEEYPKWLYDTWKHAKSARLRFKAGQAYVALIEKKKSRSEPSGVTVNVGIAMQATARETNGLTDAELDRTIDERIRLLAAIEAKGLREDG